MPKDIFYIVDSNNVMYQFWYQTRQHKDIEYPVLEAFKRFTEQLLSNENPRCVVFVFDQRLKNSQRKALYPDYKNHRKSTPKALEQQFGLCEQWLKQQNIPNMSSALVEADDVIATLVQIHRKQFSSMAIISSDKDLCQLIGEKDVLWDLQKDIRLNKKDIIKKTGVQPEQIADQLALAGDKSDNIKGIPGIGLHTAAKLLTKFGTIENIIKQRATIKDMKFRNAPFVHEQINQHYQCLNINKQLTRLYDDVEGIEQLKICRH